jgi:hypothetical protein
MEMPKLKDRAYSLASYMELTRKKGLDSSPEIRPEESGEIPPPISLSPSVLETSIKVKELLIEKEQDQHLINLLKKHCFEQSKEIAKLKHKLEVLQQDYEKLAVSQLPPVPRRGSIIEAAIEARNLSESANM